MENYFITALSIIKPDISKERFQEISYKKTFANSENVSVNYEFKGRLTNEAPAKYAFMRYWNDYNGLIDKIVVFVTKECYTSVSAVDGRSSFQYFKDSICEYLNERCGETPSMLTYIKGKGYASVNDYIDAILVEVQVSESYSNEEQYNEFNDKVFSKMNPLETRIIMDYSGGSRVTQLISLIFVRILDEKKAKILEILYADIQNPEKRLVDCTPNYNLFETLEAVENEKRSDIYEKHGLSTREDKSEAARKLRSEIDNSHKDAINQVSRQEVKNEGIEKNKRLREEAQKQKKSFISDSIVEKAKSSEQSLKRNAFDKMIELEDDKLITSFREEIFYILYDKNIIAYNGTINCNDSNKKDLERKAIKTAFEAVDRYYEDGDLDKINNKSYKCFGFRPYYSVVGYLKDLFNACKVNGEIEVGRVYIEKRKKSDVRFDRKYTVFNPSGVPIEKAERFFALLSDPSFIDFSDFQVKGDSDKEKIISFQKKLNIYYSTGFPYSCTVRNRDFEYPEVQEYYINEVEKLLADVGTLDEAERRDEIRKLCDTGYIKEKIKIFTDLKCISWKDAYFQQLNKDEIVSELCAMVAKVRPYRNAIAHKLNNEYSGAAKQHIMAEEIRVLLKKYKEIWDT